MHADPHIKFLEVNDCTNIPYDPDHLESHEYRILRLLRWIPLRYIIEAKHDVTISNRIQFKQIKRLYALVELIEETPQHLHDLFRLN